MVKIIQLTIEMTQEKELTEFLNELDRDFLSPNDYSLTSAAVFKKKSSKKTSEE